MGHINPSLTKTFKNHLLQK